MSRRVGILAAVTAVAWAAAACSKSEVKDGGSTGSSSAPAQKPTFTLFALAEMRGQIGPCGCTTDPLGDISRTAKLVGDTRAAGPTLVVDAGSLLYSKDVIPPHLENQEDLKASLLVQTYQRDLGVAALGLGPADLAKGPTALRVPRQAANAMGTVSIEAPKVVQVGAAKVGVFGVVAPDAVAAARITLGDPIAAGKAAVSELRKQGAQLIVGLVQATSKKDAAKLARDIGGIDLTVAGLGLAAPEPEKVEIEAQKIGDGWLVVPVNRGQILARIDVTMRDGGPLVDAVGASVAATKIASIDKQVAALDVDLAKFAADKDADPVFVKQKADERIALVELKNKLARQPLVVPVRGSYFTLQQIRINKTLACAEPVQSAVTAFYAAAGKANLAAAANVPVKPVAKGKPGYVGGEGCEDCHGEAAEFWKTTRHAQAWETLVERGQEFDHDCIGCHVTGWMQPGGANLGFNDKLRDVQCETCHGPGSIHVAKGGEEKPFAVHRGPATELCATQCHTKEHSDTFQLEAYLRDVLGPGHGEALRTQLGDGPTGAALRKAALEKAGRLGAGCIR